MKKGLLVLLAVLPFLSGCISANQYITVEAKYKTSTFDSSKYPEVISSAARAEKIGHSKRVVVYVPGYSAPNEKLAGSKILVQEKHRVWAAELEKQFMKHGFVVLSLEKYNDMLRQNEMTSQQAANDLNADFMVSVNSLEYSEQDSLKQQTDIELSCFSSKTKEGPGAEVPLNNYFPDYKVEALKNAFASVCGQQMLSIYLNASVIDVATGEVLFLYKNKIHLFNESSERETRIRFIRSGDPVNGWNTRLLDDDTPESKAYANKISVQSGNQAIDSELEEGMVERVCADFIEKLTKF
jgi:hypothetical protein